MKNGILILGLAGQFFLYYYITCLYGVYMESIVHFSTIENPMNFRVFKVYFINIYYIYKYN
jgi:hypothetical protein